MQGAHRFQTLYLHIGLSKTGTTSIQRDILDHAALLDSKYAIHFPRHLPEPQPFNGNHSRMLRALFSSHPEAQRRLVTIGIHDQSELSAYQIASREKLHEGFAQSAAANLLLSAESVCNFKDCDLAALSQWTGRSEEHTSELQSQR